jgi:enoyl-CoA hydratase
VPGQAIRRRLAMRAIYHDSGRLFKMHPIKNRLMWIEKEGTAMELETMYLDKAGRIGRLTLNRPSLLNAMNYQGSMDMNRVAEEIRDDSDLRVVVIRGAGRAFCTGIDLKQLQAGQVPHQYYENWDRALRILEQTEKILICTMHGYALGGGLQLALACDIRICTPDCKLGLPAIKEGIVPGLGTFRLPRYVGLGRAKWMALSGENVDGRRAYEIGLVDHVVSADGFDTEVEALVGRYSRICSEGTLQSKMLLNMSFDMPHGQFFEEYLRRQRIALASPDHQKAMTAYREGRDPDFSN